MIDFFELSGIARALAEQKQAALRPADQNNPRAYAAMHQPFNERLLDACVRSKDDPKAAPESIFIAFPERLIGKAALICDAGRDSETKTKRETPLPAEVLDVLGQYDALAKDNKFINLSSREEVHSIRDILLCHGLSPVGDSIALLADIGRAARGAWALGLKMRVMLADISWMRFNRSIRQFTSLPADEVDTGLRVCLDKRQRLYAALGIALDVHEILPYARAKKINAKKLELISQRYRQLAESFWGSSALSKLDPTMISVICRSLDSMATRSDWVPPDHVRTLGQFPGVLAGLEVSLKPHLEILRAIAQQFSCFDQDVFTYFFAQYYAQDAYRGTSLKVAPLTEQSFDEPFDRLDLYFRAWGEGHSTAEVHAGMTPEAKRRLSAVYFPQYQVGALRILPYTPLSLDAVNQEPKDHEAVTSQVIMLDEPFDRQRDFATLFTTMPVAQRNRLIGDLTSFFLMLLQAFPEEDLDRVAKQADLRTFKEALRALDADAVRYLEMEAGAKSADDVRSLWSTWLQNVPSHATPRFRPTHLHLFGLDARDWTSTALEAAAEICRIACVLYRRFLTI